MTLLYSACLANYKPVSSSSIPPQPLPPPNLHPLISFTSPGYGTSKAHIPPEIVFTLGTQREGAGNKQHEMYMPNANPTLAHPTRTIFHWLALGPALGIIGLHWALLALVGHYWLALGGRIGSVRVFRYQHVIGNANSFRGGRTRCKEPTQVVLRCSGGI